jgi:hypothetical protein
MRRYWRRIKPWCTEEEEGGELWVENFYQAMAILAITKVPTKSMSMWHSIMLEKKQHEG